MPGELWAPFTPLTTAWTNWQAEILAYFDLDQRVTNAYTEALNGVIRHTHQLGRGYSFEVIRAKMLFRDQLHKHRPKYPKRPPDPARSAFTEQVIADQPGTYAVEGLLGSDLSTLATWLTQGNF